MKSLYKHYVVVTLLVIIGIITVSMLLLGVIYNAQVRPTTDARNVEVAKEVKDVIEQMPSDSYDAYFQSIAKLGYQLLVTNANGDVTQYGTPFQMKVITEPMRAIVGSAAIYHGIEAYEEHFFFMNHFADDVRNTAGISFLKDGEPHALFIRQDNATLFSDMHMLIVAFIIITATMILTTMIVLARQLVRPLKELQLATEQIAEENYNIQLTIRRDDELGRLATQFQRMAQRLAENDQTKKDFINNVSHDFQSPLLNIQGYANVLKEADNTEEERMHYLEIIEQETKRLSGLTKQLLLLSSLDQKSLPLERKAFALDKQLKERLLSTRWLLEENDIELVYDLAPMTITGDAHLLEQVWDNLLSNAIRYSERGGKITVTTSERDGVIGVTVADEGIGIPADEIAKVTERFYRVDRARSAESSGLGLAIVDEIIAKHDGTLHIHSELGKGTTVEVVLRKEAE